MEMCKDSIKGIDLTPYFLINAKLEYVSMLTLYYIIIDNKFCKLYNIVINLRINPLKSNLKIACSRKEYSGNST